MQKWAVGGRAAPLVFLVLSILHRSSLLRPRIKDLICHQTFFFSIMPFCDLIFHVCRKAPLSDFHSIFQIQTFTACVLHIHTYSYVCTLTYCMFKGKYVNIKHLIGFLNNMHVCVWLIMSYFLVDIK